MKIVSIFRDRVGSDDPIGAVVIPMSRISSTGEDSGGAGNNFFVCLSSRYFFSFCLCFCFILACFWVHISCLWYCHIIASFCYVIHYVTDVDEDDFYDLEGMSFLILFRCDLHGLFSCFVLFFSWWLTIDVSWCGVQFMAFSNNFASKKKSENSLHRLICRDVSNFYDIDINFFFEKLLLFKLK